MKNLVLGFATNQSAEDCSIFANSLRRICMPETCDLVLIGDAVPAALDAAIRFVPTTNRYPFPNVVARKARSLAIRLASQLAATPPGSKATERMIERWHHPHFARWLAYRRFLRANPGYGQVLLTDVRDVLFQAPFFDAAPPAVQLFEQDETYGTGNCDSDWYAQAWGPAALARAAGQPALCIGTILGTRTQVLELVERFIAFFVAQPFRGVEQAIFNRLLIEGDPGFAYERRRNVAGAVATLANAQAAAKVAVADGAITRTDGAVVPIVHMYDRYEHTARAAQAYL